jgi:Mlc titration factor MtfA (ptsG expression regulator)
VRRGGWFARWRRGGAAVRVDEGAWHGVLSGMALLQGLPEEEGAALKALVERFLGEKQFIGAAGLEVLPHMALWIAAQACLPVLRLGLSAYSGWVSVILYPGEFAPEREVMDEAGVVHRWREPMAGEAWQRGPLVLSWEDALYTGEEDGVNVVIHECAHKLDMRHGGEANGFPPLPADMPAAAWSDAFGRAYAHFSRRVECGADTVLDPYAAESPGEFFAVMSEAFFTVPHVLLREYPAVYQQLRGFYRQHPAGRLPA